MADEFGGVLACPRTAIGGGDGARGSSGERVCSFHGQSSVTQVVGLKFLITQVLEDWKLPCMN